MSPAFKMLLLTGSAASAGLTVIDRGWFLLFGVFVVFLGADILVEGR